MGKKTQPENKELSVKEKKDFTSKVKKAMKGRDIRHVVHTINNEFPDMRTLEVHEEVSKMIDGKSFRQDILTAIENITD